MKLNIIIASMFAACSLQAADPITQLQAEVASLQQQLAALRPLAALVPYVSVQYVPNQPTVIFSGVNVRINNGSGRTDIVNTLGNLFIGYAEVNGVGGVHARVGSHNLILGRYNLYTGFGNVIVGESNRAFGNEGLLAGSDNGYSGTFNSILGGNLNVTFGNNNSILGGYGNQEYSQGYSVIVGGSGNVDPDTTPLYSVNLK
jgi:hypothetical protein